MFKREIITAKRFYKKVITDIKKFNGVITRQTEMENGYIDIDFYFTAFKDVTRYDNLY